ARPDPSLGEILRLALRTRSGFRQRAPALLTPAKRLNLAQDDNLIVCNLRRTRRILLSNACPVPPRDLAGDGASVRQSVAASASGGGAFHVGGMLQLPAGRSVAGRAGDFAACGRSSDPARPARGLLGPPGLARSFFVGAFHPASGTIRQSFRDGGRIHAAGCNR